MLTKYILNTYRMCLFKYKSYNTVIDVAANIYYFIGLKKTYKASLLVYVFSTFLFSVSSSCQLN